MRQLQIIKRQAGFAWLPAAIGGFASLLGGKRANVASAKQAQINRDFQERMSSTAHQREVQDLRAAGLNPILSATGGSGASTPSGSTAQQRDIVTPATSTALQLRQQKQELINMRATTGKIVADTASAIASAKEAAARTGVQENISSISSAPAAIGDVVGGMARHIRDNFGRIGSSAADAIRTIGQFERGPSGSRLTYKQLQTPVGTDRGRGRRSE